MATHAPAAWAATPVEFEVDLGALIQAGHFVPGRDAVGLRGGFVPLSWQASLPMAPAGDGRYRVQVQFDRLPYGGQAVPHKFRIERAGQGADEGWEGGRNRLAWIAGGGTRITRAFDAPPEPVPRHIAGELLLLAPVASRHVGARPVQVWLPPGYADEPSRRYPVLYMHDGQNLFDAEAAGAEWQLDEAAQAGVLAQRLQPMIIVGVPSGRERMQELTPTAAPLSSARLGGGAPGRMGGQLPAYARFVREELKPLIDARFRTRPGREHTAVGGSSLGGIASLWMALEHRDTFGAALVVSPSLWWDDQWAHRTVQKLPADSALRPRLWLDMGAQEGPGVSLALEQLCAALRTRGWHGAATLTCTVDAEGAHDEVSWASRVPAMLDFLYGPASPR